MRRRQLSAAGGAAVGAVAVMLAVGAWRSGGRRVDSSPLPLPLSAMSSQLTDQRGQQVRVADWVGRPAMVFFGFTFCPDVCPTTLSDISDWLTELGAEADPLIVALITVDPERDTPEILADYLSNFDPRIIGLTGDPDSVALAADAFRVRYEKLPTEGGDYTMNHTAGVFLFRADGSFASIIDFHEDRKFALPKIRRALT
jgi:protein SCO1